MKTFLGLVLSVIALFVRQRQNQRVAVPAQPTVRETTAAVATPRPVSEHNWSKHSLDRAEKVANQVRETHLETSSREIARPLKGVSLERLSGTFAPAF